MDTPGQRLTKLVEDAVKQSNGRFTSARDLGVKAGLANSAISQAVRRLDQEGAKLTGKTLRNLSEALGLSQDQLYELVHPPEPGEEERFPNRLWAAFRAREIEVSEAAIEIVLAEQPAVDAPSRYWLERMLAEDNRLRLQAAQRAL